MNLQDDYFELDSALKGGEKKRMRRIWKAFCEAEADADEASECVRYVNATRRMLADKPPLFLSRKSRKTK